MNFAQLALRVLLNLPLAIGCCRTNIVDSTGWVDNMLDEAGKKPERHCAR